MVKKIISLVIFCSYFFLIAYSKEPTEEIPENHIEHFNQNVNLSTSKPEGQSKRGEVVKYDVTDLLSLLETP